MTWQECSFLIRADLFRYKGRCDWRSFCRAFVAIPGFKYTVLMRLAKFFKGKGIFRLPFYIGTRIWLNRCQYRYGISIPYNTEIGPGFYIGHFGGIIVNHGAKIGWNCNISQGVTIGATYGGKHPGSPVIGNNVYLGPGSKIVGGIRVGDHVAVGANSVLTRNAPDHAVIVGIPGEVISSKGSGDYVVNTVVPAALPGEKNAVDVPCPRESGQVLMLVNSPEQPEFLPAGSRKEDS